MDYWMRSNPGKNVTIYEIPALVKKAQLAAMTPKNILSGFECTGTWPFNREIFTELDFAPAAVTDRLLSTDTEIQSNRRRRRLKDIHSRSDTNRTGAEGLSFYYPKLLYCLYQMLAVMSLSQHRVSSSKTVRPRSPCGARCIGHAVSTWSAVCSEAPHSQFGEGVRPQSNEFIQSNEFQQQSQIAKPYSSSQICSSTSNVSEHSAAPTPEVDQYVSPREIHDIPKAAPRKATNSRKRKTTRILTATPVRDSIAVLKTQTEKKNISQTKKAKKKLFYEKKATKSLIESSSEEENIEIYYDDNSDFSMDKNIVEGDYVIVNVRGRSRVVQYIARVDEVDVNEYEGVFLQKLSGCITHHETITFIVNENDCASFVSDDVVFKLPPPNVVGGASRRANQLRFN